MAYPSSAALVGGVAQLEGYAVLPLGVRISTGFEIQYVTILGRAGLRGDREVA
jgi:hypothetical protein